MSLPEPEVSGVVGHVRPSERMFPEQKFSAFRPTSAAPEEVAFVLDGKPIRAHDGISRMRLSLS